jgi:tryprostatin B 6-hydroxylase
MLSTLKLDSSIDSLPTWAAVLGFLTHWTYFIHGEHHMQAPVYACLLVAGSVAIYALQLPRHSYNSTEATKAGLQVVATYLGVLFTSMTVYRLFFHRLRRFPGPLGARISKIWHVWQVRGAQNHLVLDKIYHQYGTFVRTGQMYSIRCQTVADITNNTGPEEITIFNPEALIAMNSAGSACVRPDWYDSIFPMQSLANVRDPAIHDKRRRIWDQAFSVKG